MGVILGAFLVACAGSGTPSVDDIDAAPAVLKPLPQQVWKRCASVPTLREACPSKVPVGMGELRSYDARLPGLWGFVIEFGDPSAVTTGEGPPELVEVHLVAGEALAEPTRNLKAAPDLERAGRWRWRPWLLDDDVTWGDETGRVVLWPENPGDLSSDHVSFDWSEDGTRYRLSLRAWDPLEESVATLEAVVESMGQKPGRRAS